MSIETFNYPVQTGATSSSEAKIKEVKFDDGYTQRSPQGLHNIIRKFSVTYVGLYTMKNGAIDPNPEALEVENFLRRHKGYMAFSWTSYLYPNNAPVKVICKTWNTTYNNGRVEISMNFEETL